MRPFCFPFHFLCFVLPVFVLADSLAVEAPRSLRVDPVQGDDAHDGVAKPVKTIARALKLAEAGDTVHLAPAHYAETAFFVNKRGEPTRPITLDGHGAVLDGADELNPADWELVSPGLYSSRRLPVINGATLARFFLVFDGKMQRMGRLSKGPSAELKKPEALAPGEWTFIPDEPFTRERKDGKPWDAVPAPGTFYVRIDPAKTLEESRIQIPARSNGVAFGGLCTHLTIRNLTAIHVQNDGYNIHGDQVGLVFENIRAVECGDDGFSAHEAAECRIEGFVSLGNSTGLCDTGSSRTSYRNLYIRDCLSFDLYFISHGEHSVENAFIESSAARAVSVSRDSTPESTCAVSLRNVLVRRVGPPQELRIGAGGALKAEHCTFEDLLVQATPGSRVDFRGCRVAGNPKPEMMVWKEVQWTGEGNRYDVRGLRVDKTPFTAATFADFQKLTASEAGSVWSGEKTAGPGAGAGADESTLVKLRPAP